MRLSFIQRFAYIRRRFTSGVSCLSSDLFFFFGFGIYAGKIIILWDPYIMSDTHFKKKKKKNRPRSYCKQRFFYPCMVLTCPRKICLPTLSVVRSNRNLAYVHIFDRNTKNREFVTIRLLVFSRRLLFIYFFLP